MNYPMLSLALGAIIGAAPVTNALATKPSVSLSVLGRHHTGVFAGGAAEIVAFDAVTQHLFVVNAQSSTVDVLDIHNPAMPEKFAQIDATGIGASANSVAIKNGIAAVAIEAVDRQSPGSVAFYDTTTLALLKVVEVGALPDMVTFTPNGAYALVANEGEPNATYDRDPEGSVSVIDLREGVSNATVRTADFTRFNGHEDELRSSGVRIFGPDATAARDLEPEYITISQDSKTAWVSLQEANALALIDIPTARVVELQPLGTKDHSLSGNELDASDKDSAILIKNWPVQGLYLPDTIASYQYQGDTFIVTANEGDSRDYAGFSEERRVADLTLDPMVFPNAADLKSRQNLGRLKTTSVGGDTDQDGDVDVIYSYGGRSFSIRDAQGRLVFDSGADFEKIIAERLPKFFNSDHEKNGFDARSAAKGPEPEGLALGRVNGRMLAFIGLERVGGIMVYDITDPRNATFVDYLNPRDFTVPTQLKNGATNPLAGDLGPEGLTFIKAEESPTGQPMLAVGSEISGTTTLIGITLRR